MKSIIKNINLRPIIRNYKSTIKKIHDHGIGVIGGFILGCDPDTKDIFDKTIEFVHETGIDGCQFTIMTPFPGTRLYDQIQKEGRLLYTNYPDDWVRYNASVAMQCERDRITWHPAHSSGDSRQALCPSPS